MRDDFYPGLAARAPELLKALTPGLLNVPATLSAADLRAIATAPAEAVGLRLEDGLPERIVTDVLAAGPSASAAGQAPATLLPPLELALSQLWERREDGRLTHRAYDRIGEVDGSLATWCGAALDRLPAEHRPMARRVLTALVRPADDTHAVPATRRHVPLADLRALATGPQPAPPEGQTADQVFDAVLAALTRHRIVTTRTTPRPDGTPAGRRPNSSTTPSSATGPNCATGWPRTTTSTPGSTGPRSDRRATPPAATPATCWTAPTSPRAWTGPPNEVSRPTSTGS
ncbi:nSTAND1 domain-containing NTPase [Streptomyces radiopugnans]|uniref:nSTAND1 domain-containing NTPase n=1 Tax=Streptomyces radiopugnans TaxID=403935 RepID=UPI003F192CDD